jgi:hypothetical protein
MAREICEGFSRNEAAQCLEQKGARIEVGLGERSLGGFEEGLELGRKVLLGGM